jgi:hypothetical protein
MNTSDPCSTCGGDGRVGNAFGGSSATCPSCRGTGRRVETTGFHDVTKTKPSHYASSNRAPVVAKQVWPSTLEGDRLATEVKNCARLSEQTKAQLTREILDHESSHGACTQTFIKKIRKQVRPAPG